MLLLVILALGLQKVAQRQGLTCVLVGSCVQVSQVMTHMGLRFMFL